MLDDPRFLNIINQMPDELIDDASIDFIHKAIGAGLEDNQIFEALANFKKTMQNPKGRSPALNILPYEQGNKNFQPRGGVLRTILPQGEDIPQTRHAVLGA